MKRMVALLSLATLAPLATAEAREPYESTYQPRPAEDLLIRGATVLTCTGARLEGRTCICPGAGSPRRAWTSP
jgi:hypothetical protein